jgi:hypothetical protein
LGSTGIVDVRGACRGHTSLAKPVYNDLSVDNDYALAA